MEQKHDRKIRNFLLDRGFQLKYTGMVLVVTIAVASVLGVAAYRYSRGQTQALTAQIAAQPDMNPAAAQDLEAFAKQEDRRVLRAIVFGVLILALAMGVTGIIVTHRVVGPAYRMARICEDVGEGKLQVTTGIRKGDELQDLYRSFAGMVESLRDKRTGELEALEETLRKMESAGVQSAYLTELRQVIDRIRGSVE